MDSKIGDGSRRPSLVPAPRPEGEGPPKPGGPQPTPPGRPRLTTTPTAPAPVSSAQLSVGTTPKVSRADLEKWIASAPSNPNESRHNVYRAILDSGKPSASVMVALCKQVGDEHRVCSEFVAHVLDARANNRIDKAHGHHLLMSMLRAIGPVARHDVDVYVAAATRGFVNREGTREYHTRLREAMMNSLSTLGEAVGLQGNNLNLKSPRMGSKEWGRQNDEKRLLGHLHPDKMRADRAVNARHAIAHTAWQSTSLRDEALKRFAEGLNLGSHGKSAHALADTSQAAGASAGVGAIPAPPRQHAPSPTPRQPPQSKHEVQQLRNDDKHSSTPDQYPPSHDAGNELQSSAPKIQPLPDRPNPRPAQTDPPWTAPAPAEHQPSSPAPREIDMQHNDAVHIPSALELWMVDVSDFATPDASDKLRQLLDLPELDDQEVHIAVEALVKRIDRLTLIEQWHLMAGMRIGSDAAQVKRIQAALLNSLVMPSLRVEYALAYVRGAVQAQLVHNAADFTVQTLREFARSLDAATCHDVALQVRDSLEDQEDLQTEFNHAYLAARATRLAAYPENPEDPDDLDDSLALTAFRRAAASEFNTVADDTGASAFCREFIAALAEHIAQLSISDAKKQALASEWAREAFTTLVGRDSLTMADLTALQSALAAQPPSPTRDCFERERSLFASVR